MSSSTGARTELSACQMRAGRGGGAVEDADVGRMVQLCAVGGDVDGPVAAKTSGQDSRRAESVLIFLLRVGRFYAAFAQRRRGSRGG